MAASAAQAAPAAGRRGPTAFRPEPVLQLGTLSMVRDAVVAGAGAALLPHSLVAGDLEAGRLVVWGKAQAPPTEIWVLYSSRRLLSSKVSAFVAHLGQVFPNGTAEELAALA